MTNSITNFITYSEFLQGIDTMSVKLNEVNEEMVSNNAIITPASAPSQYSQLMLINNQISQQDTYSSNVTALTNNLNSQMQTLNSSSTTLQSIKQNLIKLQNNTLSASDKKAIAQSIQSELKQVVAGLNGKSPEGSYTFSGSQTSKAAIVENSDGTYNYPGDGKVRQVSIGSCLLVGGNVPLSHVFSVSSTGQLTALNELARLANSVVAGKSVTSHQISSAIKTSSTAIENIGLASSKIGDTVENIKAVSKTNSQIQTSNKKMAAQFTNVDMASAAVSIQKYQSAIQMSSQAFVKIAQTTGMGLMKYINT